MIALLLLLSTTASRVVGAAPQVEAESGSKQSVSVTVRAEVNEVGRAETCEVVSTDAPAELAAKVCPIMLDKAQFRPAVDDDGRPKRSHITQTVKFVLED